jgi:hypothetical protein
MSVAPTVDCPDAGTAHIKAAATTAVIKCLFIVIRTSHVARST